MSRVFTDEQWDTIDSFEPKVQKAYTTVRFSFGDNTIRTRNYVALYIDVDTFDIVSPNDRNMQYEEARQVYDWLVENDYAEWRAIGPEDSELFATDKLLAITRS